MITLTSGLAAKEQCLLKRWPQGISLDIWTITQGEGRASIVMALVAPPTFYHLSHRLKGLRVAGDNTMFTK